MLLTDLKAAFLREVKTLERELDLFPDEASVWKELPGLPNTTGSLILHLAGNLQHYVGAMLGQTGYLRNRNLEFSARGLARTALKAELEQARQALLTAFSKLREDDLEKPYPTLMAGVQLSTQLTLLQLLSHLNYHIGQIDYHRRAVTGDGSSAATVSIQEIYELANS